MSKAIVVLSGGQDSATCLALAMRKHEKVEAIIYEYGQRHAVEIDCAVELCEKWKVPFNILNVGALKNVATSALLNSKDDIGKEHPLKPGLPASFVPARNALFLTLAHARAQSIDATHIYTGVCQTDYSGYPDCRQVFIDNLEFTLNTGYESDIEIVTPLMNVTKAETFRMADAMGVLGDIVEHTHTCYNGDRSHKHLWGYGCGECPACKLREKGWLEYSESIARA